MPLKSTDIEEEEKHFFHVITTFRNYEKYSLSANNRRRKDIYRLPRADQEVLDTLGYKQKLDEVDKAIQANARFLSQIVENPEIFGHDVGEDGEEEHGGGAEDAVHVSQGRDRGQEAGPPHSPPGSHSPHGRGRGRGHGHKHRQGDPGRHGHDHPHPHPHSGGSHGSHGPPRKPKPTDFDMDKLRSTLKQFVRDWSEQGRQEREACYKPMKDALVAHFANVPLEKRGEVRVLVPGAGLGRLAYDVASMGFACQGNEFSHYMLLASYFILNRTDAIKKHTFYPYVHSFSNVDSRKTILKPISIPDILPSALPAGSNFSLVAGDFEEIYGGEDLDTNEPHSGKWDAIMTCFFIDTAKNIVNYLRIIHRILAPGGVWINLGPLLWHFENNNTNDPSVELDLDEVKALARAMGFELSNERTIDTTYTNNSEGMLDYIYHAAFWTATKVGDV